MELEAIISQIDAEIAKLQQARLVLTNGTAPTTLAARKQGGKRKLSAEGRARIAAAVRARWARVRKEKNSTK